MPPHPPDRTAHNAALAALRWAPCTLLAALLAGQGLADRFTLDLWHALLVGLFGAAILLGLRLWTPAALIAVLLLPLAWHFAVQKPAALAALDLGAYLRLEGTVRERAFDGTAGRIHLVLGEVRLWQHGHRYDLAEAAVNLPARSAWPFRHRRRIRIGGRPVHLGAHGSRLAIRMARADYHFRGEPVSPWDGEVLRTRLRDRAAYYLSKPALAVYLPVLLGVRERTSPEARDVAGAFRRVGISHLFAISGLHVGLLFLIFAGLQRPLLSLLLRGQGWVHARAVARLGLVAAVWAYIALIGFPVPAVRAALMGTLLLLGTLWGTRTPRLYLLGIAGLLFLAAEPSVLYDLSFQLSFLAYGFLVVALGLWPPWRGYANPAGAPPWWRRLAVGAALNLWLTVFITAGLWPLVAATFGRVSLLVFLGNLVMVPLLSVLVLPAGLLGLGASLLAYGAPPGGWMERSAFGLLDPLLRGWVGLAGLLDRLSAHLVMTVDLTWTPRGFFLYYGTVVLLLVSALAARRHAGLPDRQGG